MQNRLSNGWYWVRSSLWFIPCLTILASFGLAFTTLALDRSLPDGALESLHGIYAGGSEGARSLLSTVAASMITVAGVAFSITIVALSQASSQFGPRLLRNFMRDTGNQMVLGVFISTFVYCLLILRTIRNQGAGETSFVPQLSVTIGVLLALVCIGFLVYFIHHVSQSIQVDDIIAKVAHDTKAGNGIDLLEKIGMPCGNGGPGSRFPPGESAEIRALMSGYIQSIDASALFGFAVRRNLVIELLLRPGDFATEGDALLRFSPRLELPSRLEREINRLFVFGVHRTPLQDFQYGLNLIVEIAVRALSPSTNDPFTALMCVDRLEELLVPQAGTSSPDPCRADKEGKLRLIDHPLTFASLLGESLTPLRLYGSANPVLVGRILALLEKSACRCRESGNLRAIAEQARLFAREDGWLSSADKDRVLVQYGSLLRAVKRKHLEIHP